jgi:competence protein ComEC
MRVEQIDLLVLSHYDTDHVAATPVVLQRYRPAAVLVSPVRLPAANAAEVRASAADEEVHVLTARPGQRLTVGNVVIDVVWPRRVIRSGSVSNNAAVATSVQAGGLRLLFTGDIGPLGQSGLMASTGGGRFDVTTIPHHGSADQHPGFLQWTGADIAWVSAGRKNTFGHPRQEALSLAQAAGAAVGRTDQQGTLVLIARGGRPALVSLGLSKRSGRYVS